MPLGIVLEQVGILLEDRTAAGRVGDQGVEVPRFDGLDVSHGLLASDSAQSGVDLQRPAALLFAGDGDFATVPLEHPHRGLVQPAEEHVLHAAGHQGHPVPGFSLGRKHLADAGEEERRLGLRRQLCQLAQPAQFRQEAGLAQHRLEAAALEQQQSKARDLEQEPAPQDLVVREPPQQARWQAPAHGGLDLREGALDQPSVLDARGAGGLAGPARQAQLDVLDVVGPGRRAALADLHHLVDPPPGRIHLHAQFAVGGTRVEAESAVDALAEVGFLGKVQRLRDWRGRCHSSGLHRRAVTAPGAGFAARRTSSAAPTV